MIHKLFTHDIIIWYDATVVNTLFKDLSDQTMDIISESC